MTNSLNRWIGMKLRERRRQNLQKWMNCLKTYLSDKFLTVEPVYQSVIDSHTTETHEHEVLQGEDCIA